MLDALLNEQTGRFPLTKGILIRVSECDVNDKDLTCVYSLLFFSSN